MRHRDVMATTMPTCSCRKCHCHNVILLLYLVTV